MATIKQIAEMAGVSRGTVDRVLNNRGSVNANTAARVREIAEKLNYKPNKAGLMLAAQKKNLKIGVILFPDSNPFFSEVLEGVNAKAKELSAYNFTVLIRQVPFDETEQFNTNMNFPECHQRNQSGSSLSGQAVITSDICDPAGQNIGVYGNDRNVHFCEAVDFRGNI